MTASERALLAGILASSPHDPTQTVALFKGWMTALESQPWQAAYPVLKDSAGSVVADAAALAGAVAGLTP